MAPELFIALGLDPALALLPKDMDSVRARAFVVAICLQESKLEHRRQQGGGPARGYAQFEQAGVFGVLTHEASSGHASALCATLDIKPTIGAVHVAIEFNDVLAAAFTRLLIWTVPDALPRRGQADIAWEQYLFSWRPGAVLKKPENDPARIALRQKWDRNFEAAWEIVEPTHNATGEHS